MDGANAINSFDLTSLIPWKMVVPTGFGWNKSSWHRKRSALENGEVAVWKYIGLFLDGQRQPGRGEGVAEQRLLATPAQKQLQRADKSKLTSGTLPDTIPKKPQTIEMKVPNPQRTGSAIISVLIP